MSDSHQNPDIEPQRTGLTTGIIADDLTGGVLVASALVEQGIPCPVITDHAAIDDAGNAPACVVAGRFRLAPALEAVHWFDEAQKALSKNGARHIIYKYCATFDSTDRGNIGPCADALMRHTGADRLGFCTAFPSRGVTIYQGHIFLGSELLCNSNKRFDPITPMPDPDLVNVLQQQTEQKVALVPHQILTQGIETTQRFIDEAFRQGAVYFLFDAIDDTDIAVCAHITQSWPAMTGGDSVSADLPARQIEHRQSAPLPPSMPSGHTAIIAGSCAGATLQQLERFEEQYPVRRIALAEAVSDFDTVLASALGWAQDELANGPIALSVADEPDGVKQLQSRLGVEQAKLLGERVSGALAYGLRQLGVNRFIVAGGETSGAVAAALDLSAMDVHPLAGIPGGLCVDKSEHKTCCYFKAGKMGSETIFRDLIEIFGRMFDDR